MQNMLNTLIHKQKDSIYCPRCKKTNDNVLVSGSIKFKRATGPVSLTESTLMQILDRQVITFSKQPIQIDDNFEYIEPEKLILGIVNGYLKTYQFFDKESITLFIKKFALVEISERCASCGIESNIVTLQRDSNGERLISAAPIHNIVRCNKCGHHSTTFIAAGTLRLNNGVELPFRTTDAYYFEQNNIELCEAVEEALAAYKFVHGIKPYDMHELRVTDIVERISCENCFDGSDITTIL